MIITNLATQAYQGESDILIAITNIVDKMPGLVRDERPRVPNPADPAEDYADKWSRDNRLEKSFWEWHYAVQRDLATLPNILLSASVRGEIERMFDVVLTEQEERSLVGDEGGPSVIVTPTPAVVVPAAARPWGTHD